MQLYSHLLQFPLFQGMSREDLEQVAGSVRFDFRKLPTGRCIARQGDACQSFVLVLSGTLTAECVSDDGSYSVSEELSAPAMLQTVSLFGYHQRYTHTFTASTPSSIVSIGKGEVLRLTQELLVFRLNLLNIYATQAQKWQALPWQSPATTLRQRLLQFFSRHTLLGSGEKTFHILMTRLAAEVGDSRLNVSRQLNQMEREGLLTLHRGRIVVTEMERLLAMSAG